MPASESAAGSEPSILDKIYVQRVKDVEVAKNTPGTTWNDLQAALSFAPPLISFPDRLRVGAAADSGVALMAEIKRASPSKGDIDPEAIAPTQAREYALAGASVVSVLTEPTWFKGGLLDMRFARSALDSLPDRPAILRKDFVFDMYQILEARVYGADTVLLIVAMLSVDDLTELYQFAQGLGMEPLVEVNNAEEMALALELGARVIGVNNRDLKTFGVDMGTTSRLADLVQEANSGTLLCALSGISGPQDVQKYAKEGVSAVLVGEALMRADDINVFVRQLLSLSAPPLQTPSLKTRVKVDGVTPDNVNDERVRSADLVGVFLSNNNPKRISLEDAAKVSVVLQASAHLPANLPPVPGEDWFAAHARRVSAAGRPLLVGVLDDDPHITLDEIIRAVHAARLDAVQLASSTPVEWARHVPALVLRSIFAQSVLAGGVLEGLRQLGYHHAVLVRGRASGYVHELRELSDEGIPLLVLAESTSQEVREEIRPWAICSQL